MIDKTSTTIISAGQAYEITPFDYSGLNVRTIIGDNGELMWVAKDVCSIFGFVDHVSALRNHLDVDERGVLSAHTLGGVQNILASEACNNKSNLANCQDEQAGSDMIEDKELRPCEITTEYSKVDGKWTQVNLVSGDYRFHRFGGKDHGGYTMAIVEDPNGQLLEILARNIKFTDRKINTNIVVGV